jgi:AcrR family transcriptional regulator
MPKISADTIAEHVARQKDAVVRAASKLFAERGLNNVSLADIAAEVGLARNSLYRYFPDKTHILVAWFHRELGPLQAGSERIATTDQPPEDRIDAWLVLHLDYLVVPEHRTMIDATRALPNLPEDLRTDIAEGHRQLYASLTTIIRDALASSDPSHARDPQVIAMLLVGALSSAADLVTAGHDHTLVVTELCRTAHALLN